MPVSAIQIDCLKKTYRKSWRKGVTLALKGISVAVEQGEAFGFIGPNGAGKSTTIRILTGLSLPSAGEAKVFGCSVTDPKSRIGLGYVPENPYLYDYLTPVEILLMGLGFHRVKIQNQRQHCLAWIERLGLAHVADTPVRQFSKGMTQRVAIAQAMAIQPRLLILDEPLSGLDPLGRKDVVDLLAEYKRGGGTLFFTSHVLHDVERLADRVALIHQGELQAVRAPNELLGSEDVVQVRTIGATVVAGMVEEFPGRWSIEVPRAQLWEKLNELAVAGHALIEVRPNLSLEAAFLQAVRA